MRPDSSGNRFEDFDASDRAAEVYRSRWLAGEPSLETFWAEIGADQSLIVLTALIKIDFEHRFARGERPTAGEYRDRFPELADSSERMVSLIYEEFCILEENGDSPDSQEFCSRYHSWRDSLHSQLVYHRELSRVVGVESAPTKYPKVGDRFAKYHLRSILGTGGAARVFLATQDELGGRKVALKISASVGREPSILANLDHRSIVPILTMTELEDGLRGFCMPYRPGLTLDELIHQIGHQTVPRDARAVWNLLSHPDPADLEGANEERTGWQGFPISGTYSEAIAWIGLALANALVYLHGRNVLHRDIKPANVLMAYREGPQLLDFNLAHAPNAPEKAVAALKGGTLPFMAPEQLKAFLDPKVWDQVGAEADLYALGLVLRGLLTGQLPELPDPKLPLPRAIDDLHERRSKPMPPVRKFNPSVPPALESIITKALEFEPENRYTNASLMAEDLRRFLARQPLRAAENTSIIERSVNYLYRNRTVLTGLAGLLLFFILIRLFSPAPRAVRVADLAEFRAAVVDLDSQTLEAWHRARASFKALEEKFPTSAYPKLYHGQTLEKIDERAGDHRFLTEANDDFLKSMVQSDFPEAIEQRLREDPRSASLWVVKANSISNDERDPDRFSKAYGAAKKALQIDPRRFDALTTIANLEIRLSKTGDAIEHLKRAIEPGEAKEELDSSRMTQCRKVLINMLLDQADSQLVRLDSPECRKNAAATYDLLERNLGILEQKWNTGQATAEPFEQDFFSHFFGGSLALGRATLDGALGDRQKASKGFEDARLLFEDELVAVEDLADHKSRDNVRSKIQPKLQILEERRRKYAPTIESAEKAR